MSEYNDRIRPTTDLERKLIHKIINDAVTREVINSGPAEFSTDTDVVDDDGCISAIVLKAAGEFDLLTHFASTGTSKRCRLFVAERGDRGMDVYYLTEDGQCNWLGLGPVFS